MTFSRLFFILAVAVACPRTTIGQDLSYTSPVSPYLDLTPDFGPSGYFSNYLPRMEELEQSQRIRSGIYQLELDIKTPLISSPKGPLYPTAVPNPWLSQVPLWQPVPPPRRAARFGDYLQYYPGMSR